MVNTTNTGRLILMYDTRLTPTQTRLMGRLVATLPTRPAYTHIAGPYVPTMAATPSVTLRTMAWGTARRTACQTQWGEVWLVKDGLVWDIRTGRLIGNLNARPHSVRVKSLSASRALSGYGFGLGL
ncbi:MAG: hypothetical protein WAZ18_00615 [Alphaproteobacteria bacterium]